MSKPMSTSDSAEPAEQGAHPVGAGGELHQPAQGGHPPLTTNQGLPVSDNQNSLRANPLGPTLLEDFILREKITHFDHERIPERVVHARGTGANGWRPTVSSRVRPR
ncbi:catalase [Thiocystis minor]|uniref:catalase n=1 Tax=Thiocystis minor TaxID=61597 RepID=UPI0023EE6F92|nr:catalase [Thiocystis minor]